jgi:DNA-binding LytR/AlgR family response regulator
MKDYLLLKDGTEYVRVFLSEVLYIKAMKPYLRFVLSDNRKCVSKGYLSDFESVLPGDQFCRIHKSYIVSLRYARRYSVKEVLVGDTRVPIGRRYKHHLSAKVWILTVGGKTLTRK